MSSQFHEPLTPAEWAKGLSSWVVGAKDTPRRPAGTSQPGGPPRAATQAAKIMIVDDSSINVDIVRHSLSRVGYRDFVITTESTTAVSLAALEKPDVVLLDIMMPQVSGLEILEALRADSRFLHLPVIVVTAAADHETKLRALKLGATDFLAKPLDPIELVARVRNCLTTKAHHDSLATYAEGLESLVSERTKELQDHAVALEQANQNLKQLYREAEAASRAKGEFLANMGHEIRTPLTAILGFANLLGDDELTEEERISHAETIQRNGKSLLALIDNVLDLAKLEANKMDAVQTHCSVREIVDEVVSLLRPLAAGKDLSLNVDYEPSLPDVVETDPFRLRQILLNLVGNAAKFTDSGEVQVSVTCTRKSPDSSQIRIAVADTGIGMSQETVSRLFELFYQADTSMTRRFSGTGLGLAISKRLARLLGGDIQVHSELGKGSTFTLSLHARVPEKARTPRLT